MFLPLVSDLSLFYLGRWLERAFFSAKKWIKLREFTEFDRSIKGPLFVFIYPAPPFYNRNSPYYYPSSIISSDSEFL